MDPSVLDPVIHQASRLRVIALLFRSRELAVTTIRDALGMTDGNLASHLERLEAASYVKTGRVLAGVSFQLRARITEAGSAAFRRYIAGLRDLLGEMGPTVPGPTEEAASLRSNLPAKAGKAAPRDLDGP